MATWAFYGWTGGNDTAAAASSALAISGSSCLAFGGGVRTDFQSNITINNWNTAMHHATDTAESSTDLCVANHLWPISPHALDFTGLDTGCIINGVYQAMADGTPHAARGLGMRFTHSFGVKCNPVTIWAGNQSNIDADNPQSCYIAMVDLTSTNPTWSTVKPGSKLSLKVHDSEEEEHWWNVGISIAPLVVGHNGENQIKVETTYY